MAPPVPEVVGQAVLSQLAVPALPEVVVDLAALPLPSQLAVLVLLEVVVELAALPLLSQLAVLALLEVVAELAVEVPLLHRSLSAAMVGNLPSTGTPRYSPVPRSGRKARRRP